MKGVLIHFLHPVFESANTQPMHICETAGKLNGSGFQAESHNIILLCVLLRVMYVKPRVCSLMNIAVVGGGEGARIGNVCS